MWGGNPQGGYGGMGGGGGRPPDPRNSLATVLALVAMFFCLPWWMEHTGAWASNFIASKYSSEWVDLGMVGYWLLSAFTIYQCSKITIWFGIGAIIAGVARLMARSGVFGFAF